MLLGRVLARRSCGGAVGGTGRAGGAGPTRCRRSWLGRVRFDPGQPRVQQLPGAADANCWCQTLPSGTGFEAAQVSLVSCAVPTHRSSNGSNLALSASSPGVPQRHAGSRCLTHCNCCGATKWSVWALEVRASEHSALVRDNHGIVPTVIFIKMDIVPNQKSAVSLHLRSTSS